MNWLGIDIGGANIKAASTRGEALSVAFALWKNPAGLAGELSAIIAHFAGGENCLAVTMTGELADCFRTKAEGVRFIVDAVEQAAGSRHVRFYTTQGLFVDADAARNHYLLVAAANWHALASFATRYIPQFEQVQTEMRLGDSSPETARLPAAASAILLDIGSTTTDIIPIRNGAPAPSGLTDTERLIAGELVYTGVARTPLCAMIQQVNYRGRHCGIARELFATMLDVYLLLDQIAESDATSQTADGRAANKACAIDRLARMICADREMFDAQDALALSQQAREAQIVLIRHAVLAVAGQMPFPQLVVTSGQGEFLAREIAQRFLPNAEVVSLGSQIGRQLGSADQSVSPFAQRKPTMGQLFPAQSLSQIAPAFAVAVLAEEQVQA